MNEFEEKDYGQARSTADSIKTNGENVMGIFNAIDSIMNNLYGDSWDSCGAENAHARYEKIRKNYETFYQQILNMHDHIYKVTASNEGTDTNVGNDIANI